MSRKLFAPAAGETGLPRNMAPQVDLEFCRDGSRTRLCRNRVRYPYVVTSALYLEEEAPNFPTVILQSASGGYFEGENLLQHFFVGQQGQACVTTQSSTVVQTMPGGGWAESTVELIVQDEGYLEYRPRPMIMFPGSRLRQQVRARVAERAAILLAEGFLGHDPCGGGGSFAWIDSRLQVYDLSGKLLIANRARLTGAEAFGSLPGISQGAYCHASMIVITPSDKLSIEAFRHQIMDQCREIAGVYAGASALPGKVGALVRIAARDARGMNLALSIAIRSARLQILGFPPFQFGA